MTAAAANSTTTGVLPANTYLRVLGDSIVTITRGGTFVARQSTARDSFVGPYPVDSNYSVVAGDAAIDIRVTREEGPTGALVPVMLGQIASGSWFTPPSVFRLRLTGTGTVQLDSRDSAGNVTAVATYTLSGATDQIEFPYAGDNAVAIRATFGGDITVEVI